MGNRIVEVCGTQHFLVIRKKDTVLVSIMHNRADNKYHFVNQSHGHICACAFDTLGDAIADMERLKQEGKLIDYMVIKEN